MTNNGISQDEAEELTVGLGQIHAGGWRMTASLIRLGVPKALGLSNEDWVKDRLGGTVRLAIDERREAVEELTAEGMSQREIAAAIGVSQPTVNSDLRDPNLSPEPETLSSESVSDQNVSPDEPDEDTLAETLIDDELITEERAQRIAEVDALRAADNDPYPSFTQQAETGQITWDEAETQARQWRKEFDAAIQRNADRIQAVNNCWAAMLSYLTKPTNHRNQAVRKTLPDSDIQRINKIRQDILTHINEIEEGADIDG